MKTLILGIGNPILTDDGVGIKLAQRIRGENPDLEVVETSEAGIALLDYLTGYDKLIIIDSIKTGKGSPGELYTLELGELRAAMDSTSSHGIDIATAFEVGVGLGCKMPQTVSIYAVEVRDNITFGEGCTPEVEESIPLIAKQIMREEGL